jgi:hypothetical protein
MVMPLRNTGGRKPDPMNPYDGAPGFWNRVNKVVYRVAGPAQVGIGRSEQPYAPPADPRCPLCGEPMTLHTIDRTGPRTQLYCPQ